MAAVTAKMDRAGRIMVPQQFRKELGLKEGSEVRLTLVDGELRLTTREAAWAKAREFCMSLPRQGQGSVVDELSRERRAEALKEFPPE